MKTVKKTSTPMEVLTRYLRESGQRLTSERIAIVEVMINQTAPFTIEEIHARIEKDAFPVARATVYNTINILTEAGLLDRMHRPDGNTNLYAIKTRDSSHIYYICTHCGKVKEATAAKLTKTINEYDFRSFSPHSFALSIYGLCSKCSRDRKNKSKTLNDIQ